MKNQPRLFEEKPFVSKNVFGLAEKPADDRSARLARNTSLLNTILVVLIGFLGIWYALWTNLVISGQYHERLFRGKLESLRQENNRLLSEKSSSANLGALLVFAKDSGLVEQKNIEYLFDRQNVARK